MKDIDWNEVMRISRWYAWKRLRSLSCILGNSEIVAETMLTLVKMDAKKWDEVRTTTLVCYNTKWTALRLYDSHQKNLKLDGYMAFPRESHDIDFDESIFRDDLRRIIDSAKSNIILDNRHNLLRVERYKSGFLERRIVNGETLDTLAASFGVTKERARRIEGRFWREMQLAIMNIYGGLDLAQIWDLHITNNRIIENKELVFLLGRD